jgi:hypothetical protein
VVRLSAVAEQLLRDALVDAALGERRAEGVAQVVDAAVLDAGAFDDAAPHPLHVALVDRRPLRVENTRSRSSQ